MTGKIKRRSLRCGGRPKADFGSLFTSVIAPALNAAGSIADESIDNNKTATNGVVNNNTTIPSDPTKTPTMRLGGRKKCWIGAAIGAATSIAGSLFGNSAQKREMRRQQSIRDWQNATQEAANMTTALNNSQDYQEDYLRQFRTAARLGKTLGAKSIYITDGGDATKIGNNTYLLRGGSHEDVNETGQTGIGINVGGNEVEAEGGEVAQKKNGALRIFSAQPILSNGMSPAQAILRGYNKDSVFSQQQTFKKRKGLKDDGSAKYGLGGDIKGIWNFIRSYRTPVDQGSISKSAARIINPREAEIVRMGIPISQSAKTMTSGANPFLYTPRSSNKILEGLNRVISNAKQGVKSAGQKVGNNKAVREFRNLSNKDKVKYIGMTGFAATALPAVSIYLGNKLVGKDNKSIPTQKDAHGKPISQYIARPQAPTQQPSRTQIKKAAPTQKSVVVPKQVKKAAPQYKGNTTKGNYQLHDGETRTINGIKYIRRGNAIINHKTNVAYIYDKNGNYTGQADYSKVGNFNQAFDAARAASRSQFIYRAGKYNNYSTIKESNAKKERLNRIVSSRRVAKALGGYSRPVEGMRPKALGGMYIPFNKRYTSIYDAPDYDSDYNGGNVLGNGEVTVTAKRIKPTFMKPNNDAMNLIKVPKEEVPYIPQKHNRSRTIFSGGDYLGLGIDTLAALSTGLVNYNTAGKYTLPDRAPIIQASKLPTTYNVNPEIEEVKRYRDRLTGQTFNNTSSSVAALNRSGAINLDALSNLSKLWATKENEENKMLTEDAKNQQTVAAQNVQNELARQSEIARIKNEATQAKGDALNVGLSGLSQAWTNFWTAGRTAYEDDQSRRAMIASSKEATPTRLSEMDFDLSPDILASLYRTAKDDRTRRFYLSRLSPKQRLRYGIN